MSWVTERMSAVAAQTGRNSANGIFSCPFAANHQVQSESSFSTSNESSLFGDDHDLGRDDATRTVRDSRSARRGRHGRGLPRPRYPPRSGGGDQGPTPAVRAGPHGAGSFSARGASGRLVIAPEY